MTETVRRAHEGDHVIGSSLDRKILDQTIATSGETVSVEARESQIHT